MPFLYERAFFCLEKTTKMYYDKITELIMKETFASFFVFFVAALPAFAASTCETRVDSHPDATTKQRVAYCLTPEPEPPLPAGPELVYYGVADTAPESEPQEAAPEREPVYFDKDGVAVNQHFVDTKNFPAFENDMLSEQERAALERLAKQDAAQAAMLRKPQGKTPAAAPSAAAATPLETPSVLTEENEAGLLARHQKPRRFMKTPAPAPQPVSSYDESLYGVNAAQPAAYPGAQPQTPAVPTGTPQGELQQAYALENDPLAQPSGNAGGAAPNGFLDNNLAAGEQSFGYNATDPAMQP